MGSKSISVQIKADLPASYALRLNLADSKIELSLCLAKDSDSLVIMIRTRRYFLRLVEMASLYILLLFSALSLLLSNVARTTGLAH